jgi:guanylate kinase
MLKAKNNLIIFTGPSGVGKGTIVKKLFKQLEDIKFSVSCTTREKRPGEEEGINYFYKTQEEFDQMINNDELLEWAEFVGNKYGTPRSFVVETLQDSNDVFLEIEVQGALQVMEKFPGVISIFLVPPTFEDLETRLRQRGTESEGVLQQRLTKAREEMKFVNSFDYIVMNDDLDKAVETIKALILQARFNLSSELDGLLNGAG